MDITSNITIIGQDNDARQTIIQAGTSDSNGIDRVFHIRNSATVTMEKITVRYGRVGSHGAGIYVDNGNLTLNNSTVTDNLITSSSHGSGIRVLLGSLTLNQSTISYNTTSGNGGGIQIEYSTATLTIKSSTISNNSANGLGGGIYFNNGTGKINNSTIASNTSNGNGGGIYVIGGTPQIKNTIIADNTSINTANEDCHSAGGSSTSGGYNLVEVTGSCSIFTQTGDITGSDPNLAALANNGGPTDTHAIQNSSSPAIDAGDPTNCQDINNSSVTEDQRAATRSYDGNGDMTARCDIGAYEFGAPTAVTLDNFSVVAQGNLILVTWNTVSESHNLGFDLYRSTTEQRADSPLNEVMISAQAPGSGQGSSYSYEDYDLIAGTTYYYWLVDVNLNHVETYHGPVTILYDYRPTAITTHQLESKSPRVTLVGLVALIGVVLIAAGLKRDW